MWFLPFTFKYNPFQVPVGTEKLLGAEYEIFVQKGIEKVEIDRENREIGTKNVEIRTENIEMPTETIEMSTENI